MSALLQPRLAPGFRLAVVVSVLAHLGVFAGVFAFDWWQGRRAPKPLNVMQTRLVRLGKPKPKDHLPRLPAKVTPPKKAPVVVPKPPTPEAKPPPPKMDPDVEAKQEAVRQAQKQRENLLTALKGLTEQAGQPDGSVDGTVDDVALAVLGNKFITEVHGCMRSNYALQGLSASQVGDRRVTVLVHVRADGRLIDASVLEGSGLELFDRSVLQSVRRCAKVSPPPLELRKTVSEDGIEVDFGL